MRVAIHAHTMAVLALFATLGGGVTLAGAQQGPGPVYSAAPAPVAPLPDDNAPWRNVVPEPGVVVSGDGSAYGPVQAQPPVVYAPPAYVYPAYPWPQAYVYPPVGISLNLGYSGGWHGGRHFHRGWR